MADLDPETAYKGYLERAFAATNRRDFDLATLEFMAGFRNKHTQFDDQWLRRRFGESLGFVASQVDGKWLITRTEVTSVRKGDIIRMIEGMAVEAFVRDQEKFISASSERSARSLVFDRPYLFPEVFTLELEDGRKVTIRRGAVKKDAPGRTRTQAAPRELRRRVTDREPDGATRDRERFGLVDDDVRDFVVLELGDDLGADAAVPADDEVVA